MAPQGTPIKELSGSSLESFKDLFALPPRRVIRAWERAPVAAQAPRLNGQKIWKKRGGRLLGDKENSNDDAQVELDKEGVGARKRVRVLDTKENIGNAPWKKVEHAPSNLRSVLATKDANIVFQHDISTELCGNELTDGIALESSKSIKFVPRKRTNTDHVITPKKNPWKAVSDAQSIVKRSSVKDRRRKSTRRSSRDEDTLVTDRVEPSEQPAEPEITRQKMIMELPSNLSPEAALTSPEERQNLEAAIEPTIESSLVESVTKSPQKQRRTRLRRSSRQGVQSKRSSITAAKDKVPPGNIEGNQGDSDGETMHISELIEQQPTSCGDLGQHDISSVQSTSPSCDDRAEALYDQFSIPQLNNLLEKIAGQVNPQNHQELDSPEQSDFDIPLSTDPRPRRSSTGKNDQMSCLSSPETAHQGIDMHFMSFDGKESEEPSALDTNFRPHLVVVPDSPSAEVEEEPVDDDENPDEASETESDGDSEIDDDSINNNLVNDDADTTDNKISEPMADIPALMEDNDGASDDDVDIDLLNDFVARMRAAKEAKGKKEMSKRKSSGQYSPMSIMVDIMMANQIPDSPDVREEFDMSSSPSSKKRSKRNKVTTGDNQNAEGQSTRRSGRTRIPVVKPPPSTPSFIPVRRLGQDDEMASGKNDEKEITTLTRVNTRKNKADAVPAGEVLVRLAVEKELLKRHPAFQDMKERKEKYDDEKYGARKSQKKAKSVTWAERLEEFQSAESQIGTSKDKVPKAEAKKTAVKVGVRSSKIARVPSVNGTPISKRKSKGRS